MKEKVWMTHRYRILLLTLYSPSSDLTIGLHRRRDAIDHDDSDDHHDVFIVES
jgi:hypothetical protein